MDQDYIHAKWNRRVFQFRYIPVIYFVASCIWVYATNATIFYYIHDPESARWFATYKGWLFIILSSVGLHFIINVCLDSLDKQHKTILKLAFIDQLTNVSTRQVFIDRVEQLLKISGRNESCFGLIFIDIDNFKAINDTYGHLVGDQVLIETASRLKYTLRQSDTISRFGGDEFLVLVPDIRCKDGLIRIKDKVTKAFCLPFEMGVNNKDKVQVSLSFGIALFPDDGNVLDDLIKVADEDMYRDKRKEDCAT